MSFALIVADVAAVSAPTAISSPAPATAPAAASAPAAPARGELFVALGVSGGASDWSGDPLGYGGLALGMRLFRLVTPYVGVALGYGRVDERLLTRLSFGVDIGWTFAQRFRPRVYAAFVHQHEESLAAVSQEPFGAVLGIGLGIRHRAGVHAGLGFDFVIRTRPNYDITIGPDFSFMNLTYSSGPNWYYMAGVTASGHIRLF